MLKSMLDSVYTLLTQRIRTGLVGLHCTEMNDSSLNEEEYQHVPPARNVDQSRDFGDLNIVFYTTLIPPKVRKPITPTD
jgi:hypothetical protein